MKRAARHTSLRTLSSEEIAAFVRDGYIVLRGAFLRGLAERIVPLVWAELGMDPSDRATWPGSTVMLSKVLEADPTPQIRTDRYLGAIDDLCGEGRWRTTRGAGYWPIRFPGFASPPWKPPTRGWHLDQRNEPLRVASPDRGLICLELFTEIGRGDGGTAIRAGSHQHVSRILWGAEPSGLDERELTRRAFAATHQLPVVEIAGSPGDVVLMHAYTLHAASANTGRRVRILAHRPVWLHEPLRLARATHGLYSPVERAIVDAVAGGHTDA